MKGDNNRIIIFDGVCNLCDYSIQFIIRRDPEMKFKFVAAQSEVGKKLQLKYGVDTLLDGTVIFIENSNFYIKSDAVLEIARNLSGPLKYLHYFKFIPRPLRDLLYTIVSKYRYRLFGEKNECLVPDAKTRERFL